MDALCVVFALIVPFKGGDQESELPNKKPGTIIQEINSKVGKVDKQIGLYGHGI